MAENNLLYTRDSTVYVSPFTTQVGNTVLLFSGGYKTFNELVSFDTSNTYKYCALMVQNFNGFADLTGISSPAAASPMSLSFPYIDPMAITLPMTPVALLLFKYDGRNIILEDLKQISLGGGFIPQDTIVEKGSFIATLPTSKDLTINYTLYSDKIVRLEFNDLNGLDAGISKSAEGTPVPSALRPISSNRHMHVYFADTDKNLYSYHLTIGVSGSLTFTIDSPSGGGDIATDLIGSVVYYSK